MPRMSNNVVKVNMYLDKQVLEILRRLANLRGCAYSELVREALRAFVLTEGPKLKQQDRELRDINTP